MEIVSVRLTPNVRQKFVLVRVMHSGLGSTILWGNPDIEWHKDIVEEIAKAGYEVREVLGGGWVFQKPEEKIVYIWGKSDRYGSASIEAVREVLNEKVIEGEPA